MDKNQQERFVTVTDCVFNDRNNTVLDKKTNLEWHMLPDVNTSWNQSKEQIEKFNSFGWKMPNLDQLKSLYQNKSGLPSIFEKENVFFWSSETRGSRDAWGFNFSFGDIRRNKKTYKRICRGIVVKERLTS